MVAPTSVRAWLWVLALLLLGPLIGSEVHGRALSLAGASPSGPTAFPDTGTAPTFVRTQWTVDDGLPVNAVNDLARTDDGYLWMATFDGLVRFDGSRFRVYRSGTTPGLPSSRITRVHPHPDGLWLVTESRQLVHVEEGQFTSVTPPRSVVSAVHGGPSGGLWVGTDAGVYQWEAGSGRLVQVLPTRHRVLSLLARPSGALWIGTEAGLVRRAADGTTRRWTAQTGLAGEAVFDLAAHADSASVWVGTFPAVQRWHPDTLTTHTLTPAAQDVHDLFVDAEGTAWLTTPNRLYRARETGFVSHQARSAPFTTFRKDRRLHLRHAQASWTNTGRVLYRNGQPVYEAESTIEVMQPGPHGMLWLGTSGHGLVQLHPSRVQVVGEAEGLPSSNVYPIAQHRNGDIWMGTLGGGAVQMDSESDSVTALRLRKGDEVLRNVWALHQGRSGAFWVGGTALCRVENGRCARPDASNPFRPTRIRAIHEDRAGRLWVGTETGLYMRAAATDPEVPWRRFAPDNSRLPHEFVRTIYEGPGGALWFGTNGGGMARYQHGRFAAFTHDDGLPSNLVRDIHRDETGAFWVGTEDYGLVRIEWAASPDTTLRAASLAHISMQDGLFDNVVHRIIPDAQGRFWMSSNRGLFWVRRAELEAVARGAAASVRSVPYTTRHGLRNREANGGMQPAGIRARDGRLWFPTQGGAVVIDPRHDPVREAPPPLVVERLTPEGAAPRRLNAEVEQLAPDARSFSIRYAALHFRAPEHVQFRYRLDGLHTDWVNTGSRREAFFTDLDPGTYTFRVAARSARSEWSPASTRMLRVTPRFYETTWFAVLVGILAFGGIGAAVYGGMLYRLKRLRKRKEELRTMVDDRTKALREEQSATEHALDVVEAQAKELARINEQKSRFFESISHELRTPLALIKGPVVQALDASKSLSRDLSDMLRLVARNSTRLQTLTNHLLDLAKYDAGQLTLSRRRYPLHAFVERVASRFSYQAQAASVALQVQTETAHSEVAFDATHMETVLANLIDNAIKHTPSDGSVEVEAEADDGTAYISVADTGPGLSREEQDRIFERFYRSPESTSTRSGSGIGLALAHALADLHGGTLTAASPEAAGAVFTVAWPTRPPEGTVPERGTLDTLSDKPMSDSHEPTGDGVMPARNGSPVTQADVSVPDEEKETGDQTTVLVVDDDPDMRAFVQSVLAPTYRVQTAADGDEALTHAQAAPPDCIVADVMMPRLDGMELVTALRSDPRTDCIPVVMLTARAETQDRVSGLNTGADAYVTKPFAPSVLRAHVHRHIATRHRLRERLRTPSPADAEHAAHHEAETAPALPLEAIAPDTDDPALTDVSAYVMEHLADPDLAVADLANAAAMSPRTLRRRLKEATGHTPTQFLKTMRLEAAARLLQQDAGTIAEVAYAVGFNSHSYFSRSFKSHFGVSPSAYEPAGQR